MSIEAFARQSLAQFSIIYAEIFDGTPISPEQLETLMWGRMCAKEAGITKTGFKIPFDSIKRAKVTLPYMPDNITYTGCSAIKKNGGLYTPCCGKVLEGGFFCKTCSVDKEGDAKDLEFGSIETRDANIEDERFAPVTFGEWMKGHKTTLPEVYSKLAAAGIALEIPSDQLICRSLPKTRRGRPSKSDEEVSDEDSAPKKKPKAKKASPAASEDDEPKKKPKAKKASPAASEDDEPKKKPKAKKASPAASEDDEPKKKPKAKKASPAASEDEKPKKPKAKKEKVEPEPESESDTEPEPVKVSPKPSPKTSPKASPAASEDDEPKKAPKAEKAKEKKDKAEKAPKAEKAKEKAPKAEKPAKAEKPEKVKEPKAEKPKARTALEEALQGAVELEELGAALDESDDEGDDEKVVEVDGKDYILRNDKFICSDEGDVLGYIDDDGDAVWNSEKR